MRRPRLVSRWRRRTPTMIQMEATECGAAALGMILGYYGRHVLLDELRELCGVSRDGSRASTMLTAARKFGLTARGFQADVQVLLELERPAIVFWAFQHFLVIEGIRVRRGRKVIAVNDPASGPRLMSWEEFDSGYTGILLTFEPGPEFKPGGRPSGTLAALLARRSNTGRALPLVLLASALLLVPGLAAPAFTRVFIDDVLSRDNGYLPGLLAAMIIAMVSTAVLTWVQRHYLMRLEIRLGLASSARFFLHLLRLPVSFYMARRPAEVAKRVSNNDAVAEMLSRDLAVTVINLLLVSAYAVVLVRYDVLLGLIGISLAALNVAVLQRTARTRTDAITALRTDIGNLTATTFSTLQMIETVKATGAEHDTFGRWSGYLAKVVSGKQRLGSATAVLMVIPAMLASVNSGLLLLVGGLRVIDGAISIGLLIAFQSLLGSFSRPVTQLVNLGERLQDMSADLRRLADVEGQPVDVSFTRVIQPSGPRLHGTLEFRDVTFGYSPLADPVIRNLSFVVVPGRRVALVGGSGSGKSTVSRLATGLFQPWSGEVLLDGTPRDQLSRTVVAASLAYVDQEISLFEATVRQNLTLWNDDVPDEFVLQALRDAVVYDVVAARAGGINSLVLEGGRNFSGGQRQRLELARALAGQPSLLVLDEASSALDAQTERLLMDNLRKRGCACLIIAHRLTTVYDADEIIVLANGVVAERGTHEQLLAAGGGYAELIASAAEDLEPAL